MYVVIDSWSTTIHSHFVILAWSEYFLGAGLAIEKCDLAEWGRGAAEQIAEHNTYLVKERLVRVSWLLFLVCSRPNRRWLKKIQLI